MLPEIKTKWVKALRSGEYKQGEGYLEHHGHYCCLGVLCMVQGAEPRIELERLNLTTLPEKFAAGLSVEQMARLANMNDGFGHPKHTFAQIADAIEANL